MILQVSPDAPLAIKAGADAILLSHIVGAAAGIVVTMPFGIRERRTVSSPSLISSSARFDSSSRSISFLILRRSMGRPS